MESIFKLGKLQKAWIRSLRLSDPARQMKNKLGIFNSFEDYHACCLGEALVVKARLDGYSLESFYDTHIRKSNKEIIDSWCSSMLAKSFKDFGLRSRIGEFSEGISLLGLVSKEWMKGRKNCISLMEMNDSGYTWKEIGAFMRKFPHIVFKESK